MKLSIPNRIVNNKQDALLATGTCLVAFLWFFSYYSKNEDLLVRYHYEIKSLETQQSALRKAKALQEHRQNAAQNLKLKLKTPLKGAASHNPKCPTTHMTDLAHKACKTGLRLDSCSILKQKKGSFFTKQNIVYELSGTQNQIKKFIEHVQHSEYALRCKKLELKKTDATTLHLACTLQFLVFNPNTSQAHAQQPISPSATTQQKQA